MTVAKKLYQLKKPLTEHRLVKVIEKYLLAESLNPMNIRHVEDNEVRFVFVTPEDLTVFLAVQTNVKAETFIWLECCLGTVPPQAQQQIFKTIAVWNYHVMEPHRIGYSDGDFLCVQMRGHAEDYSDEQIERALDKLIPLSNFFKGQLIPLGLLPVD